MQQPKNIGILFIAGFGPIVSDPARSRALYGEILGIPFKEESDGYLHTKFLQGAGIRALAAVAGCPVLLWQRVLAS